MGVHATDNILFFKKTSSSLDAQEAASQHATDESPAPTLVNMKEYLRQTVEESSWYFNHVISLQEANDKSLTDLERLILDKNTLTTTSKLLEHLEKLKTLFLSTQRNHTNLHWSERVFLSAYMIATKSQYIFESPTNIDELLLSHANAMIRLFEKLCKFMSAIPITMTELSSQIETAKAQDTTSTEQVFVNMGHDDDFMLAMRAHLEDFYQSQKSYYETFSKWEVNNRLKLTKICIIKYLQLESKRVAIFTDSDPRMLDMYAGLSKQQDTLRDKIQTLLGMEGLQMLDHDLQEIRTTIEANKWAAAPDDILIHEIALNPKFKFSPESIFIKPQKDINTALLALSNNPINIEPILDVFIEIRDHIASLKPHNEQYIAKLQEEFNKERIKDQIECLGLKQVLSSVSYGLIEKIQELESTVHDEETSAFKNFFNSKLRSSENHAILLKETIDFFYRKLSQIKLEINNYRISQARTVMAHGIVEFEQNNFQERLAKKQFNLAAILTFIDAVIKTPTKYRLDTALLCSQYSASYLSHAACIELLQQPGNFDLQAIPETFYLDKSRLVDWHAKYQRIFYTAAALGIFCQQYGASLLPGELLAQKKILITALETNNITGPKAATEIIVNTIGIILAKKGKQLSATDEIALTKIMEETCTGKHPVAAIINKRLGDQLWFFSFNGFLPEDAGAQAKLYGLQAELNDLGQEILPLLRLHVKVHGDFYRQSINERLWKPLFMALKSDQKHTEFSALLAPRQEVICETSAAIHKMVFLLTGLSIIQQNIAFADMWNLHMVMKNSTIKDLAAKFGLIDMMKDPRVSKEIMKAKLIELMKHVASEHEIAFDVADEQNMSNMLDLAKNGKSSNGYNAYLDEILNLYKQFIIKGKMPELKSALLTAEFSVEIKQICVQVQDIIDCIKHDHIQHDNDPVAQTIPTLRAGKTIST